MRTMIFTAAAAASALAFATPASAHPNSGYGYGHAPAYGGAYGAPYGNSYGNRYAPVGHWAQQLDRFRYDVRRLSQRGLLTRAEQRQANRNIRTVQRALRKYSRNGINGREAWDLDRRMANLERSIMRSARDRDVRRRAYYGYRR